MSHNLLGHSQAAIRGAHEGVVKNHLNQNIIPGKSHAMYLKSLLYPLNNS